MATYTHSDFEQIATAIGTPAESVANLKAQFKAAAIWFRLDQRRPERSAPSKLREKLNRVASSARRLLKNLGINDPDEAADGPGDREIFDALVLLGETDATPVLEATRRIGRLVQLVEFTAAAAEFERRAQRAANEVTEVGKLMIREGNPGDDAVNDWIANMLGVYRTITGTEPATSVGAPERFNEGIASGLSLPKIIFARSGDGGLKGLVWRRWSRSVE
jgi:hypothetical protein